MKYINPRLVYIGCCFEKIEIDQIRSIPHHYNWRAISYFYDLSESFIVEFQDLICWDVISEKQNISDSFIINYFDKLDLEGLLYNKNISGKIKNYIRMFI